MSSEAPPVDAVIETGRPAQLAERLDAVKVEISARFVEIGELLYEAHTGSYHLSLGYPTFEAFVEARLEMSYRKARYLAECFKVLIQDMHVSRETVAQLGWTKAKELIPVIKAGTAFPQDPEAVPLTASENREQWIEAARHHTTSELNLMVREAQAPAGAADTQHEEYSTLGIGLWASERTVIEEAIEFAKLESGTERTGTALLRICQDYIQEARARASHAQVQSEGEENAGT